MATVYYADNYRFPVPEVSDSSSIVVQPFIFTPATALIINDTVKLAAIKALTGIILLEWYLDLADQDSGTAAWTFDLGDNTTAAKFVANSSLGQSAAIVCPQNDGVVGAIPCRYTANNDFVLKVHTAPGTGPTGTNIMKGWIKYSLEGVPSGIS